MDNNLDINLVIQAFQEKISQLSIELVVKEATIKQLISQLQASSLEKTVNTKNKKESSNNE